jgi:phage RecT family recombinase
MSGEVTRRDDARAVIEKPVLAMLRRHKDAIARVAAGALSEDRVFRLINVAFTRTPELLDCTAISVLNAVLHITYLGLEIAPEQAYIVPFRDGKSGKRVATPIIDFRGLIRVAANAEIVFEDPEIIYAGDKFQRWTDEQGKHFRHEPQDAMTDRGPAIGVYTVSRWHDIAKIHFMSKVEIEPIKSAALARGSVPWKENEFAMWRKTVIRRAFKTLPRPTSEQHAKLLSKAQELDDAAEMSETIEPMIEGDFEDEKPIVPTGTTEQQQEVAQKKIEDLQNGKPVEDTAARYEAENEANRQKAQEADGGRKPLRFGRQQ